MNRSTRLLWALPILCGSLLHAEDLAPTTLAKILKLVLADAKEAGIACSDPLLRLELVRAGVPLDPESRIVWVRSTQELAKYAGSNRLLISGRVSDLSHGAIVALVGEGGHGVFYLNKAAANANKVVLPTAVMKLGKVVQ